MSINYFDADELARWFADEGDKTHRLNYDLGHDSVVLDLGGYYGEWTRAISERYNCVVHVFEPVAEHYQVLASKLAGMHGIFPHRFALADRDGKSVIRHSMDSSSMHLLSGKTEEIDLVDICTFMEGEGIGHVDLMKINIEGSEYDLMEHMIANRVHHRVRDIQVQFHKMFPDSYHRREQIRSALMQTHRLTYDYLFVWENWRKIDS